MVYFKKLLMFIVFIFIYGCATQQSQSQSQSQSESQSQSQSQSESQSQSQSQSESQPQSQSQSDSDSILVAIGQNDSTQMGSDEMVSPIDSAASNQERSSMGNDIGDSSGGDRTTAEILSRIFNGMNQQINGSDQNASASDQFDQSLDTFDGIMGEEQQAISNTGVDRANEPSRGEGASDEAGMQRVVLGGTEEIVIAGGEMGGDIDSQAAQSSADSTNDTALESYARVSSVEGCSDEDIVAQQLCEAATLEEDPFLRAALWREYNQYREILDSL